MKVELIIRKDSFHLSGDALTGEMLEGLRPFLEKDETILGNLTTYLHETHEGDDAYPALQTLLLKMEILYYELSVLSGQLNELKEGSISASDIGFPEFDPTLGYSGEAK